MSDLKYLNLDIAKYLINEVEKIAAKEKIPVVIAIANAWGMPIAIHFMDNALPASLDIAINKAYTSATVRVATKNLKDLATDSGDLFGIINSNNNKIITFPGGFPLEYKGKVVGAIGVSGGNAKYDNDLACIAKEIYKEVVKCIAKVN